MVRSLGRVPLSHLEEALGAGRTRRGLVGRTVQPVVLVPLGPAPGDAERAGEPLPSAARSGGGGSCAPSSTPRGGCDRARETQGPGSGGARPGWALGCTVRRLQLGEGWGQNHRAARHGFGAPASGSCAKLPLHGTRGWGAGSAGSRRCTCPGAWGGKGEAGKSEQGARAAAPLPSSAQAGTRRTPPALSTCSLLCPPVS